MLKKLALATALALLARPSLLAKLKYYTGGHPVVKVRL